MQQCGIIIFFKAINAKLVICCGYETWEERNEKEKIYTDIFLQIGETPWELP